MHPPLSGQTSLKSKCAHLLVTLRLSGMIFLVLYEGGNTTYLDKGETNFLVKIWACSQR